jgi:hypothetical protein
MRRYLSILAAVSAGVVVAAGASFADSTGGSGGRLAPGEKTDRWPKKIEEFLSGDYLQRADVILTQRAWDPVSFAIRTATNSEFSHAAAIYSIGGHDPGISSTWVIEAITGGVDLTRLDTYLKDKSTVVAIKRLDQPWFQDELQNQMRGEMLEKIDAGYGYGIIADYARSYLFAALSAVMGRREALETVFRSDEKNATDVTAASGFICSGFVQFGFVTATIRFIEQGKLEPWYLNEVLFDDGVEKRPAKNGEAKTALDWLPKKEDLEALPPEARTSIVNDVLPEVEKSLQAEIFALQPEDLARSKRLAWQYLVKDGMVYRVSSYDDVKKLMK